MTDELSSVDKEKFILEAQQIEAMIQSPGWKVIVDEVSKRHGSLVKSLVWEDDNQAKDKLQANIRGLEFLLKFPGEMLETAKRVTEEAAKADESTI